MTAIRDLNPNFARKAARLEAYAARDSFLKPAVQGVLAELDSDYSDPKHLLTVLQASQRLIMAFDAGVENNARILTALSETTGELPSWDELKDLPVERELQETLGDHFLNAKLEPGANVLVMTGGTAPMVTEQVVDGYIARGTNFDLSFNDRPWQQALANFAGAAAFEKAGTYLGELFDGADKMVQILPNGPFENIASQFSKKGRKDESKGVNFILTMIPTEEDARIDGMDYKAYLRQFFELCDQPWDEIAKAQEKLVAKFDAAKELRLTNDDGTDITLNITDQTFLNTTIHENIPGSEIFSAPKKDGVNGTLVAKGKFQSPIGGGIIENMTLQFVDGKVVSAKAEKNENLLRRTVAFDEGSRFIGEIGIGTNPWLKKHVANPLLVEKISGSFHLALGNCYKIEEYNGKPVNIQNGNNSKVHWDVTTMLLGRGGKMYLDGELIQENGKYLDPELDVFNKGWKAIDKQDRPAYWQKRLAEEKQQPTRANAR